MSQHNKTYKHNKHQRTYKHTYNIVICIYYIAYVYRRDDCIGSGLEMVGLYKVWESLWGKAVLRGFTFTNHKYPVYKNGLKRS